jgi:hypothetical protein
VTFVALGAVSSVEMRRLALVAVAGIALAPALGAQKIDVHRPLTIRLFYYKNAKPEVRTVVPLKS